MKVISPKNLPAKLPIWPTAIVWLLLDRLNPAGWVHGVAYTLLAILWIAAIVGIRKETHTDIFSR